MFGGALFRAVRQVVPTFRASCDDEEKEQSIIEQADAAIEAKKLRIRTPMQFADVKNVLGQGHVGNYDGFRIASQKQVNLNTVVSHFYWIGSQTVPPMYQYRIILHDTKGDTMMNIGSDVDFNIDGEFKAPLLDDVGLKLNFQNSEQAGKSLSGDISRTDWCSSASVSMGETYGLQYMQALTPALTLGGSGEYNPKDGSFSTLLGGIFDTPEHQLSAMWSNQIQLCYLRRVNPNRVHLSTELKLDPANMKSEMSVTGEYTLKQSKVNFGIDSAFTIKSLVETTVTPGVNMQMASEVNHMQDSYKFGFGFVFNN
jgi:hypothetical protein